MNTASASETATDPSWSTSASSGATQSWPASTGYEQYYNYYQTIPPPAGTAPTAAATAAAAAATTTNTTNYQQDYSQAWDEYYKAYYGQSYATTGTAAQYPTGYSYDQYGYANFSAPPPNYYEQNQQYPGYDYNQANTNVSSAPYSSYNTASTASVPPTTNWSEPPPSFTQPSTYNNAQPFDQSQSFNQPPPISSSYESSMDPNNSMQHSATDQFMGGYGDDGSLKLKYGNSKMYESNSNSNFKSNQSPSIGGNSNESSYIERFPPPSFGSPVKSNNRGRGGGSGNFNNSRGGRPQQGSRNSGDFNQGRNQQFSRGRNDNKNNNDRRPFNDYSEENSPFVNSNFKQNNNRGNNRRGGNRGGGFNTNRGRGGENQSFQQRNSADQWYQENEPIDQDGGYGQQDFEDTDYFQRNNIEKNEEFEMNYGEWNLDKPKHVPEFNGPNYGQHGMENFNQKRDFEAPKYPRNSESVPNQKYGYDNQEFQSRTNVPNVQQQQPRNGTFPQNNRQSSRQTGAGMIERTPRSFQSSPRQQQPPRGPSVNRPPVKLMDVVVQLSPQSQVVKRRQNMIDQWQHEIRDMHNRRITVKYFWPVIKSALAVEMQDMLFVNCYNNVDSVICELVLDDIFLCQGRSDKEELAIESASKILFDMFKNRLHVITSAREADGEMVPCFSVNANQYGTPVSLPPICRHVDKKPTNTPFLVDSPEPENFTPESKVQASPDSGLFLVLETSTNERDQSIASLVATARFNNSVIDYQHEKLPHAPHISQCVIAIDGVEVDRHEARDYLVAKRQAADKVVAKLKQTRPQITLRLDKAKLVKKEDLKKDEPIETTMKEYLQNFITSPEDIPLKFDTDFSLEEKNNLSTMASNLNLSIKSEGKNTLFIFKQFPVQEMKNRLLSQGFCAQYQLIEKGSDFSSQ